ncbi:hypothetical protein [Pseudonocardia sp. KRD291]|uniref:hypothetical protein n=1 Tax=Pseudonocardia sp. KRD291 TaxID=2792007 RepID=UPI001C49F53E|nr:hypothetical protein [Pseudonocardia sp. KRD291]MBW0105865.1 hypothetical protein [Pseudonocardia sp. KRD291]
MPIVLSWCLIATAASLLGFGLLTVDRGLVQGAGLVILCLPIAWLVGVARRSPASGRPITSLHPPSEPPL